MVDKILHKDLSEKTVKMFIEVSQKYGHLHKEKVYQKACEEWLEQNNFSYTSQPRIDIVSLDTGEKFTTYIPDLLINELILIELKAQDYLPKKLISQLEQYLKASKYEVGYLVNFGKPKADWHRRIYTNDRKPHINP
jgi:GxxExxY protein